MPRSLTAFVFLALALSRVGSSNAGDGAFARTGRELVNATGRVGKALAPAGKSFEQAYCRANVPMHRLRLGSPEAWKTFTGNPDFGILDYAQWLGLMCSAAAFAREGAAVRPMARAAARGEARGSGLPIGTRIRTKQVITGELLPDHTFVIDHKMWRTMRLRQMTEAEAREAMTNPVLTVMERNHILGQDGIDYYGSQYRFTATGKAIVYDPWANRVKAVLGLFYDRDPSLKEVWAAFLAAGK